MRTATMTTTDAPVTLDQAYAANLRLTKQQLVDLTADDTLHQTGGAYVGGAMPMPDLSATFVGLEEPRIETYLVDDQGVCTPTGNDDLLINSTKDIASAMAVTTLAGLASADVSTVSPGYLTASVLPIDQVADSAHFDDDQFEPAAGVGVVATLADCAGTRLALDPVPLQARRPNMPVTVSDQTIADFDTGADRIQRSLPGHIFVFPQFGQFHAGPPQAALDGERTVRTLLVFRMGTTG